MTFDRGGLIVSHWIVAGVTLAQFLPACVRLSGSTVPRSTRLEDALVNLEYWINTTFSLLNWLFFHTIYGMLGVAILVYLLFRDLRKTFPRFPEPALVAGLVFLVGVGTLPSIPRYQFHNEMLELVLQIENDSVRVASTSRWRSITEPLTWVNPPIGAVTTTWLQSSHFVGDGQRIGLAPFENRFYERTLRYGEKPAEALVYADCVQTTIRYARSDESGGLQPVTPSPVKMVTREKDWYCEHDWSREKWSWEKEALLRACGKACQVLAIHYIRRDEEPNNLMSTRAADQAFGAKKCTDKEMTPIQITPRSWTSDSKYSTRHWVVLCARPQ